MFSRMFIERPRFAMVISIVLTLAGAIAVFSLPISLYPQITPPEVVISATYPGASAEVLANTVGIPLEEEVNGIEDMLYMDSSSENSGQYSLTVTFKVGIDPVWGTWFAYRAAILTDTALPPSAPVHTAHPCETCVDKPCIAACGAGALAGGEFNFPACTAGRLDHASPCALGCTARSACPVGAEHRYADSQVRHSAAGSLAYIRQHFGPRPPPG